MVIVVTLIASTYGLQAICAFELPVILSYRWHMSTLFHEAGQKLEAVVVLHLGPI